MRHLIIIILTAISINADGQVNPNYNPDYNGDDFIGIDDILGILSLYDNPWAEDCAGVPNGSSLVDECGVCDSDPTNDCVQDCNQEWGGTAELDECGACDSDPSNDCVQDCNGDWGGIAALDECGVCDEDVDNDCIQDCNEEWGGTALLDECGVCDSDPTNDCVVFQPCGDPVAHEGYEYSTVQIGEQCWFSENCRYLPEVSYSSEEGSYTEPYYYVYGYNYEGTDVVAAQATNNYETYGVLYNWPAVMTEGICPSGWHIPSDEEFTELTDFLGGESVAGYVMKSTSGWNDYNGSSGNGSNSSGFNGLPGGARNVNGSFMQVGEYGMWWSSSLTVNGSSYSPLMRRLHFYYDGVGRFDEGRGSGFSARCIRD